MQLLQVIIRDFVGNLTLADIGIVSRHIASCFESQDAIDAFRVS